MARSSGIGITWKGTNASNDVRVESLEFQVNDTNNDETYRITGNRRVLLYQTINYWDLKHYGESANVWNDWIEKEMWENVGLQQCTIRETYLHLPHWYSNHSTMDCSCIDDSIMVRFDTMKERIESQDVPFNWTCRQSITSYDIFSEKWQMQEFWEGKAAELITHTTYLPSMLMFGRPLSCWKLQQGHRSTLVSTAPTCEFCVFECQRKRCTT